MAIKNPFEILGLNPYLVRELSEEQLHSVVKSMFRTLQLIYHPDRGGREGKSREINAAREVLENPETFESFRKDFIKGRGKRIVALEKELEEEKRMSGALLRKIVEYMQAFAGFDGRSVFDRELSLNMFDSLAVSFIKRDILDKKKCEPFFYELVVDAKGEITKIRKSGEEKYPWRRLIGTIPYEEVMNRHGSLVNFLRGINKRFGFELGLGYQRLPDYKRVGGATLNEYVFSDGRIDNDTFERILPYLRTELKDNSFLFAINKQKGTIYFSLEGKIISGGVLGYQRKIRSYKKRKKPQDLKRQINRIKLWQDKNQT